MNVDVATLDALSSDLVAIGVPVVAGPDGPRPAAPPPGDGSGATLPTDLDPDWCKRHGFSAKVGQTLVLRAGGPVEAETVLVGVGDASRLSGPRGVESIRRAVGGVRARRRPRRCRGVPPAGGGGGPGG